MCTQENNERLLNCRINSCTFFAYIQEMPHNILFMAMTPLQPQYRLPVFPIVLKEFHIQLVSVTHSSFPRANCIPLPLWSWRSPWKIILFFWYCNNSLHVTQSGPFRNTSNPGHAPVSHSTFTLNFPSISCNSSLITPLFFRKVVTSCSSSFLSKLPHYSCMQSAIISSFFRNTLPRTPLIVHQRNIKCLHLYIIQSTIMCSSCLSKECFRLISLINFILLFLLIAGPWYPLVSITLIT